LKKLINFLVSPIQGGTYMITTIPWFRRIDDVVSDKLKDTIPDTLPDRHIHVVREDGRFVAKLLTTVHLNLPSLSTAIYGKHDRPIEGYGLNTETSLIDLIGGGADFPLSQDFFSYCDDFVTREGVKYDSPRRVVIQRNEQVGITLVAGGKNQLSAWGSTFLEAAARFSSDSMPILYRQVNNLNDGKPNALYIHGESAPGMYVISRDVAAEHTKGRLLDRTA
jgi:hypothetical protein